MATQALSRPGGGRGLLDVCSPEEGAAGRGRPERQGGTPSQGGLWPEDTSLGTHSNQALGLWPPTHPPH